MRIDIISDTVCPWCFIGKRRLERALNMADHGAVEIGWRPFQLNPDMPEGGVDRREYLKAKFGGDGSGGAMYDAIRAAGEEERIPFDLAAIRRQPNTLLSHRLIRYAASERRQDAVVEGVFRAYFTEGRDIGDVGTLVAIAAHAGLEPAATRAYLESDEDRERVLAEDRLARELGVQGVPCFIVNRRYAVSGAQDPAVFLEVFDTLRREEAAGAPPLPTDAA